MLSLRIRKQQFFSAAELLLMFVLLLSFMNVNNYSMHLMVMAFAAYALIRRRLWVPKGMIPIAVFFASLVLFWSGSLTGVSAWMKRLVWPAAFLLGYHLVLPEKITNEGMEASLKKAEVYVLIAVVGYFIHILLNVYMNWGHVNANRNTIDFWSGQNMAATGQAGLMCVPLAWCCVNIIGNTNVKIKIMAVFALLVMMYYNLIIASRTVVVLAVIAVCVPVFFLLFTRGQNKKRIKLLTTVAIMGVIALWLVIDDVGGIRTFIEESVLGDRMTDKGFSSFFEDSRWRRKIQYVELMMEYPFGGGRIRRIVGQYAHDVLLDTYDEASVFAFLAICAMLWDGISKLRRLLKQKRIDMLFKMVFLCVYVLMYLEFAIEPIFAGLPWLLMTFCFFHGIVTCLVRHISLIECDVK